MGCDETSVRLWAVDGDGWVVEEGDLVCEEEFGDGEVVLFCGGEEVGGAAEGVGNGAGAGEGFGGAFGLGDDEAAADGVEDFVGEGDAGVVEGGEAHAVGVGVDGHVGIHLVAAEVEVFDFDEGNGFDAVECEGAGGADGGDLWFDGGGIDGVGRFAEEAEKDGAVGAVADAGEGERAVEVDVYACGALEEIADEASWRGEAEGGAHGADGVGAGGADADFEEFEEAGVHGVYCRRWRRGSGGLRRACGFL